MPADRRTSSSYSAAVKPMKTERTHEENQERAYIAASRRSDRSLEARIESARRASEIHKKRTGRALRVTEQDVVNEEMYEEEDDDLPTQYQRLNAHLQTSSWLFNRKLHDYIATQHGVRNMFMHQQFPGQVMPQYDSQFQPSSSHMPMMGQSMLPPQTFSPATPNFVQSPQLYTPQGFQQQLQQQQQQPQPQHHHHQPQNFRQAPYSVPTRNNNMHQRSASVSTPLVMPSTGAPVQQQVKAEVTTPSADTTRRLSLPHNIHEQQSEADATRPSLSRSSTAKSGKQLLMPKDSASPTPKSGQVTPQAKSEHASPTQYGFPSMPFLPTSQVIGMNPLSLSLPPESQQFVGSALDPQDPRTAILMGGSDNLAQPFMGTYTYNPNLSPKSGRAPKGTQAMSASMSSSGMSQTLAPDTSMRLNTSVDLSGSSTNSPPSGMMDGMFTSSSLFSTTGFDQFNYFDPYQNNQNTDSKATNNASYNDQTFEDNSFINWDQ